MNPDIEEPQDVQSVVNDVIASHRMSDAQKLDETVAAVISAEADVRFLSETLESVLTQSVLPGMIIIADCSGATKDTVHARVPLASIDYARGMYGSSTRQLEIQVVQASGAVSFVSSVRIALSHVNLASSVRSLWLLHDDSRPASSQCLEIMLEAWRNAPTASVLGAKQLGWRGDAMHDVGCYATMHHGVNSLVVDGEPDQEQYDARQDVFMVDLAGSLMSVRTWHDYSEGVNMGVYAESADLCRRVCLSGGRVLVVPQAAVAHRRARLEGMRTGAGAAAKHDERPRSYVGVVDARERYRFTDISMLAWLPVWLWRFVVSLALFIGQLTRKRPYEAFCELSAPWRVLFWLPNAIAGRRRVTRQSTVSLRRLSVLVARRDQLSQWRERSSAFENQRDMPLLSPLQTAHLASRRRRRWAWSSVMLLLALVGGLAVNHTAVSSLLSGGGAYSSTLVPTGASFSQLVHAATSTYSYADVMGGYTPPAPFLLVLMLASVLTMGHVSVAVASMLMLAAPCAALSFWALAGIFTRSNAVRCAAGLLWVAFGGLLGIWSQGNLPMMVVMAFLPAGLAFAFRAVGMYRTEVVVSPTASVQSAALSALCLMLVVVAEPQLLLSLIVVFLFFLIMVRSHCLKLLLIPVPAAFAIAPTLMNVVLNMPQGAYRQLFADVMVPSEQTNGLLGAGNLASTLIHALRLEENRTIATIIAISLLAMAVLAVIALALPFALRVSRMMWMIVLAGAALMVLSSRIAVAPGVTDAYAGTVLPGLVFAMAGLLSAVCMVAGVAAKPFAPLISRADDQDTGLIESRHRAYYVRRNLIVAARGALVILLTLCLALWSGVVGMRAQQGEHIASDDYALPLVAQDYLHADASRRILAVSAVSSTMVKYSSMRTSRGDLIDVSPAMNARGISQSMDDKERSVADAVAKLLVNTDSKAIDTLSSLGFGGIFIPYSEDSANRTLAANVLASDGTQSVVSNESGTYIRLTDNDTAQQGIDITQEQQAMGNPWRITWLWCMGIVVVLYCLVAAPRVRRF